MQEIKHQDGRSGEMSVNDFWDNMIESNELSDSEQIKKIYEKKLESKIDKRIKIKDKKQQKAGYDVELHLSDGRILTVEEKIRKQFHPDLLLEIKHYNGYKKPGWLFHSNAEILAYFQPYKHSFHLTLWKLKELAEWVQSKQFTFLLNSGSIKEIWSKTNCNGNRWRTKNYAVSFRILRNLSFVYKKNECDTIPIDLW